MNPVFLFPGQGSQYVGMGREFHEHFPAVQRLFEEASEILEMDLRRLCFEDPDSTLIRTDNVQPAVTLVNLACLRVLQDEGVVPVAAGGHSLGEYAALCAAGVFSVADTLRLVRHRGVVMQQAAQDNPGGMIAVMGLPVERFQSICERAAPAGSVEIANHNSPAQVILTGEQGALKAAAALAKKEGAVLVVPLKVSGPWHSRFMGSASRMMAEVLAASEIREPAIPVVSNVTGDFVSNAQQIRDCLVQQIVQPVQWVACENRLLQEGHRLFVEVGPGHMLGGLMRDNTREATVINVENLDGLARLRNYTP
jgi:[acyl-carrier-protein] S-malonyltransferase